MQTANAYIPSSFNVRDTSIVRGSYKKKPRLMALNQFDLCLYQDQLDWEEFISGNGLQTLCCPTGRPKYAQRPWISMPREGRRFKPIGSIPVSGITAGVDTVVMSQLVPIGYDGVITDIVCEFVGPGGSTGFVDGSGDATWRLSADKRYLRDLGNITVTLGSLITPSPVQRTGLIVRSHDLLEWVVNITAGGLGRINPQANVVCSVTGWWYPR